MKKVIFIVGPTASGKSAFAHSLIDNEFSNSSILSMDSMQIYKHMNIGSAKPSEEEIKKYNYSMIDFVNPLENFTVKNYIELSQSYIENSCEPLFIVGGTGLYMNALKNGIFEEDIDDDKTIRYELNNKLEKEGLTSLYESLKTIDIETANEIDRYNPRRVIRALEVYYKTGKKMSDIKKIRKPRVDIKYISFFINLPRDILYKNIDERVDKMFESGLIEEVKYLVKLGVKNTMTSMQAIGYKETLYFINSNNTMTEKELREKIKLNTRHYAKRQITWFKKEGGTEINLLDNTSYKKAVLDINNFISH